MQRKTAVRLDKVCRIFGSAAALRDISLEISSGEILSLVGPSGCGKSTLLRIIAGVETSDAGRVFLDERMVDGGEFIEPERRRVGFVFQDYALFPHLSVRDNILFGVKRHTRHGAAVMVSDMMERIGILHLADRFPHTLSGGEQQRVALARALAPKPSVVLLDEPFSNLDQGLRERVRSDTLSVLRSTETTVIMVTHDPAEALSSGDRVVLMRAGEIVQAGTPREVYSHPANAYVADFFCAFNKIPGVYRDGCFETAIGRFVLPPAPGREGSRMLYVRPQAIRISTDPGEHTAYIEERIFLGASEKVVLKVEGLEGALTTVVTEPLPPEAKRVSISIAPELLLAF